MNIVSNKSDLFGTTAQRSTRTSNKKEVRLRAQVLRSAIAPTIEALEDRNLKSASILLSIGSIALSLGLGPGNALYDLINEPDQAKQINDGAMIAAGSASAIAGVQPLNLGAQIGAVGTNMVAFVTSTTVAFKDGQEFVSNPNLENGLDVLSDVTGVESTIFGFISSSALAAADLDPEVETKGILFDLGKGLNGVANIESNLSGFLDRAAAKNISTFIENVSEAAADDIANAATALEAQAGTAYGSAVSAIQHVLPPLLNAIEDLSSASSTAGFEANLFTAMNSLTGVETDANNFSALPGIQWPTTGFTLTNASFSLSENGVTSLLEQYTLGSTSNLVTASAPGLSGISDSAVLGTSSLTNVLTGLNLDGSTLFSTTTLFPSQGQPTVTLTGQGGIAPTDNAIIDFNSGASGIVTGDNDMVQALPGAISNSLSLFGNSNSVSLTNSPINIGDYSTAVITGISDNVTAGSADTLQLNGTGNQLDVTGIGSIISNYGSQGADSIAGANSSDSLFGSSSTLTLAGMGDLANVSGASDSVTLTAAQATAIVAGVSDSVLEVGTNEHSTLNGVGESATAGGGSDSLTLNAASESGVLAGLNESLTAYGSGASVIAGGGGNAVTLAGTNDAVIAIGPGNITTSVGVGDLSQLEGPSEFSTDGGSLDATIASSSGDGIVLAGTNQSAVTSGYGDTVLSGGSNNAVHLNGSTDSAQIVGPADAATAAGPSDQLSLKGNNESVDITGGSDAASATGADDQIVLQGLSDAGSLYGTSDAGIATGAYDFLGVLGNYDSCYLQGAADAVGVTGFGDQTSLTGSECHASVSGYFDDTYVENYTDTYYGSGLGDLDDGPADFGGGSDYDDWN